VSRPELFAFLRPVSSSAQCDERGVASRFSIVRTIDFMRFELASMDRRKHAIGRAGALAPLIAPAARHCVMVKAAIPQ